MAKQYGDIGKHFNNKISTIKNSLDKELTKELVNIGEDIVNKLKVFLQREWYDKYTPLDYERTYSLKNALRYTIEGNKVRVYFDRRYFSTKKYNNGGGWQPHRGFDGVTFIDGLIDFLNDGTGNGGMKSNPRRFDGNIDILGYAEEIINEHLKKVVDKKIKLIMKKYL